MKKTYKVTMANDDCCSENWALDTVIEDLSDKEVLVYETRNRDYFSGSDKIDTTFLQLSNKEIQKVYKFIKENYGVIHGNKQVLLDSINDMEVVDNENISIDEDQMKSPVNAEEEIFNFMIDEEILYKNTLEATGYSQSEWQEVSIVSKKPIEQCTVEVFATYMKEQMVYVKVDLIEETEDGFKRETNVDGIGLTTYGDEDIDDLWKEAKEHFSLDESIKLELPEDITY